MTPPGQCEDPDRRGVTVAKSLRMLGRNAAADNLTSLCDSAREGQACSILHMESAEITDRFA